MLNLLKKSTPWMVASLFVATAVFAQEGACQKPAACQPKCAKPCPKPCPQPCPPTQVCPDQDPCCPAWPTPVLNAAYNYPARIQTRCPWDLDFNASFIYWQPIEENLELGAVTTTGGFAVASDTFINMDFDYKPGFKVGAGGYFDHDNWDVQFMYTWFHNTNSVSWTQENSTYTLSPLRGHPDGLAGISATSATGSWNLKMDVAEVTLGRWSYVGTKFTVRPSFGARADWIRQTVTNNYTVSSTVSRDLKQRSTSWGIGAQAQVDANYNIGSGFRFYGTGEADLLFTKYSQLTNRERTITSGVAVVNENLQQNNVYAVRPHIDLELGLGWGTYLDCNNWYLDFSAGYGFQVFFNQNVNRFYVDDIADYHSFMPNGDLFVHGLTVTTSLTF